MPRVKLAQLTKADPTLETARALADRESEGYHWKDDLLFITFRLDEWGENYDQLCFPKEHREKCLILSHERFSHPGRNKMTSHLRKLFYWPSLTSDVAKQCCINHNLSKAVRQAGCNAALIAKDKSCSLSGYLSSQACR